MASLQDDFQAAGAEYGRRLVARQESDRLAALKREGRHDNNAELFAAAIEPYFSREDTDVTPDE